MIRDRNGNALAPSAPADAAQLVPTGKGWGQRAAAARPGSGGSAAVSPFISRAPASGAPIPGPNGITHYGGPLLRGEVGVYFIWYGDWGGNSALPILTDFAESIGGSPWFNIVTTYDDGRGNQAGNSVSLAGASVDRYSQGKSLDESGVQQIVERAIGSGALSADAGAVYFVLASADVSETSGFCTRHCGWHSHARIKGSDLKYAFVGNPDRCPNACAAQATGPNGNAAADAMASTVAAELAKAVTDPELNAWYDARGRENADKCAWKFGSTYTTSNGARANMKLGSRHFLVQQNWVNAGGGYCASSYP